MEKSGHKHRPPTSSTTQTTPTAVETPNSIDGVDTVMTEMTVEEAMDMDPASESEGEEDEGDVDMEAEEDRGEGESDMPPPAAHEVNGAAVEISGHALPAADPRRRPPNEGGDSHQWDLYKQPGKLNGVSVA